MIVINYFSALLHLILANELFNLGPHFLFFIYKLAKSWIFSPLRCHWISIGLTQMSWMCLKGDSIKYSRNFYGKFEFHLHTKPCFHDKYSFSKKQKCVDQYYRLPETSKIVAYFLLSPMWTENFWDPFSFSRKQMGTNMKSRIQLFLNLQQK